METTIAIIGILVAILLWLFPPEPFRNLFKLSFIKDKASKTKDILFLIRLGNLSKHYWGRTEVPLKPSMIDNFKQHCSHFFQLTELVEDIDPSFDITIINELNSPIIIHELGVEIVSVAHEVKLYGTPQATRVLQQASCTIEIPDIRGRVAQELGNFPRLLEPQNINLMLLAHLPDPFRLEPGGTFRFELLLKDYVAHMPNYAVLKFWISTQKGRHTSDSICVFTL